MNRHYHGVWVLILTSVLAGCGAEGEEPAPRVTLPSAEGSAAPAAVAVDETRELWFVELEGAPLVRGGALRALQKERARFFRRTAEARLPVEEHRAFGRLWNGLSVKVARKRAAELKRLPGVKAVYPVVPIELDDAIDPSAGNEADLYTALAETGANIAQSALGFTGKGVKVGLIDSGIDYDHPDLGGCFGPGCRVAFGYDFVGDAFDASERSSEPAPDSDPDDCAGHGTHVAGIIGANGAIKGVAPGVTYGAYRVFGCNGTTSADLLMEAMERAEADGMQVVNVSIGSSFQWPDYPTAKAANELVAHGIVVVGSAGNKGDSGLYAVGAPGVGKDVISVASVENTAMMGPAFLVSPGEAAVGFTPAVGAPKPPSSGSHPLVRRGSPLSTNDGCSAFPAYSLTGAVALIRRGGCSFREKAANAVKAGAVGVVIYNNKPGPLNITVEGTPEISVPVLSISEEEGEDINGRMSSGGLVLNWSEEMASVPNPNGGRISDFSSWGLSATLDIKPDIAAPGGSIYSTMPLELGGYASNSGTSMAAPHVTGAVALLLEARPGIKPRSVRDLLQNYASVRPWEGAPGSKLALQVNRQGAGLVQIDKAILGSSMVVPGKLPLGESEAGPAKRTLTITNWSPKPVTYTLSHMPAVGSGGVCWTPEDEASGVADVQFSASTVTVPGQGGTATVDVTITANPALPDGSLYGGYVVFSAPGGSEQLQVPYAGFKGDYQSIEVLAPGEHDFPWLALREDKTYTKMSDNSSFSMEGADVPTVVVHFGHFARKLELDVFDATSYACVGRALEMEYVGHSSSEESTKGLRWDGTVEKDGQEMRVPRGRYALRLRVLKALGDESVPSDWETWVSPVVRIQ